MPIHEHMSMLAPLTWHRLLAVWMPHPLLLGLAGLVALGYVFAVQEVNSRGRVMHWPRLRTTAFMSGVGVLVWAICGSPGAYGEVLFSVHMVRHLLLIMVVPGLLALGRPVLLAAHVVGVGWRRTNGIRWLPQVAAAGVYVTAVAGLHLTGFMQAMMERPVLGPV